MISPSDCGLAITYPLYSRKFKMELTDDAIQNFPKFYRSQLIPGSVSEIWKSFSQIASKIKRTCKHLKKLGVKVVFDATLDDVASLFKSKRVVTIFSHHHIQPFSEECIIDAQRIKIKLDNAFIMEPKTPIDILIKEIAQNWHDYIQKNRINTSLDLCNNLKDCFNDLLNKDYRMIKYWEKYLHGCTTLVNIEKIDHFANCFNQLKNKIGKADWDKYIQDKKINTNALEHDELYNHLAVCFDEVLTKERKSKFSRVDFEIAFPNEIKMIPAIDFADGAKTIDEIIKYKLIPGNFNGVCDFSICYSDIIGSVLKGNDSKRKECICIVNELSSHIEARLLIYEYTIKLLAAQDNKYDYMEANYLIRKKILERRSNNHD